MRKIVKGESPSTRIYHFAVRGTDVIYKRRIKAKQVLVIERKQQ
jgi:hypothetical protein